MNVRSLFWSTARWSRECPSSWGHFRDPAWSFIDCSFPVARPEDGPGLTANSHVRNPLPVDRLLNWAIDRVCISGAQRPGCAWLPDDLGRCQARSVSEITGARTFGRAWDPEDAAAPRLASVVQQDGLITLAWAVPVTVKVRPSVAGAGGREADCMLGFGRTELRFRSQGHVEPGHRWLNGGALVVSRVFAGLRFGPDGLPVR